MTDHKLYLRGVGLKFDSKSFLENRSQSLWLSSHVEHDSGILWQLLIACQHMTRPLWSLLHSVTVTDMCALTSRINIYEIKLFPLSQKQERRFMESSQRKQFYIIQPRAARMKTMNKMIFIGMIDVTENTQKPLHY